MFFARAAARSRSTTDRLFYARVVDQTLQGEPSISFGKRPRTYGQKDIRTENQSPADRRHGDFAPASPMGVEVRGTYENSSSNGLCRLVPAPFFFTPQNSSDQRWVFGRLL